MSLLITRLRSQGFIAARVGIEAPSQNTHPINCSGRAQARDRQCPTPFARTTCQRLGPIAAAPFAILGGHRTGGAATGIRYSAGWKPPVETHFVHARQPARGVYLCTSGPTAFKVREEYLYISSPIIQFSFFSPLFCQISNLHSASQSSRSTINMSEFKPETTTTVTSPQPSFHEYTPSSSSTLQPKRSNIVASVGLGVNVLSLLSAITILGTAGDVLSVYNATHLGDEFFLPIWPADFDIRPSVALVTCAAIITFSNIISIVAAKVPAVRSLFAPHYSAHQLIIFSLDRQ